ncbi:MAG: FAD-dependent oxidoreductase [Henriciella sp.]|nr:FAD-dependent oxidoreductase [Henriciella sp.]
MTVVIIGAGMAGLSAARALQAAGREVELFDKGRGPGGRMSTRRAETDLGQVAFDHGAQYFTARDPEFAALVSEMVQAGAVAEWQADLVEIDAQGDVRPMRDERRFVGVPGMNGIIRAMAAPLSVQWAKRLVNTSREEGGWRLVFEDGEVRGGFDQLLFAVPAEQAVDLFQTLHPPFASDAAQAVSDPCWALMLAFEERVDTAWDGGRFEVGAISWAARNSSKPGRSPIETWTLHASPEWSKQHLEADPQEVVSPLLAAFGEHARFAPPIHAAAHRWRYAQITRSAQSDSAWNADLQLGMCGDWRIGARVEAAWLSGRDLALRTLCD